MPVAQIAQRANISRANAYSRLERFKTTGVIEGFRVRTNPRAIGLEVTALTFLSVEQGKWREIRDRLVAVPETDELRDVILERFVEMAEVRSSRTVFLLDDFWMGPIIP